MSAINDQKHLAEVCRIGQGDKCCSYVGFSIPGFVCLKETEMKKEIDIRRWTGTIGAMGDNCSGFSQRGVTS